jgi:hypothetical protein
MATPDQLKQIWAIVLQALPTRLTWAQAQYWIGHGRELAAQVHAIFAKTDPYRALLDAWVTFYRDEFGIVLDPAAVRIPEHRDGFDRLIVVAPGITIERVLAQCQKYFKVWRWTNDDLDKLTESVRSAADGLYAVWVRDRVEADEEHKNKSYNDLQKAGVPGITLLEYVLLHLQHYRVTGQHPDASNITLCTGSLYRGGGVSRAYWHPGFGKFCVSWYDRGHAPPYLRCREAVVGS